MLDGTHGRTCTGTGRILSALSLGGRLLRLGLRGRDWYRVKDLHPQPSRSKRDASAGWANAAVIKWCSWQDSRLQPRRSKRRTLII